MPKPIFLLKTVLINGNCVVSLLRKGVESDTIYLPTPVSVRRTHRVKESVSAICGSLVTGVLIDRTNSLLVLTRSTKGDTIIDPPQPQRRIGGKIEPPPIVLLCMIAIDVIRLVRTVCAGQLEIRIISSRNHRSHLVRSKGTLLPFTVSDAVILQLIVNELSIMDDSLKHSGMLII